MNNNKKYEALRCLYLQQVPAAVVFAALTVADAQFWRWTCLDGFVRHVLRHETARRFPVDGVYQQAVAKLVSQRAEEQQARYTDGTLQINGAPVDPDELESHDDLILMASGAGSATSTNKELSYKTYTIVHDLLGRDGGFLLPTRVGPQFRNVGLSLWPSAFALLHYVLDELHRPSHGLFDAPARVLELGAGVGLTGGLIASLLSDTLLPTLPPTAAARLRNIEKLVLTDYQDAIVSNCRHVVEAAASMHSSDASNSYRSRIEMSHLDWTEGSTNAVWLAKEQFDVVLAADVTYDVDVLPDLARTIAQALSSSRDPSRAVCVLFATHRNEETVARFIDCVAHSGCAMESCPVDWSTHPSLASVRAGAVEMAREQLKGMASTADLLDAFWVEMPHLLRRHTIRLGSPTPSVAVES